MNARSLRSSASKLFTVLGLALAITSLEGCVEGGGAWSGREPGAFPPSLGPLGADRDVSSGRDRVAATRDREPRERARELPIRIERDCLQCGRR